MWSEACLSGRQAISFFEIHLSNGRSLRPFHFPAQVLAMTTWNEGLLHSVSHSIAGIRNDVSARSLRPFHFPAQVLAMTTWNEGFLHSISLSIAGVRNDGFMLRHCEHRVEVLCVERSNLVY